MRSLFVTGTDTGAGKTLASATLLHAARARGLRAIGMKPVASGCESMPGGWRNADALALQSASEPRPVYEDLNPFALPEPLAPELASRAAGIEVTAEPILAAFARLSTHADMVVVEGVGGWAAPLSATLDQRDLVRAMRLPVVLVVGLRLGCLNHARLTADAIRADGCELAGWIACGVDPLMACREENLALLDARLPAPRLGYLPPMADPQPVELAHRILLP
ncbi:dethiobiotin synthase [Pseudoxanthomonas daejeonensis]|uniref:ATP-dependent dethiobiotin synthetase BioD n=1 Tax=Pseudoxanthomonas daejeonensis TaxID=266062 RepID=A0ABQ6ZAS0_9GAMM|nr:dethiobiotin synthase [Pseudoxanthomonas daejeonensis]KAF1696965.1 dethiobiotin synthase [Pseudoxanthomonas daejeonensis]